MSHYAQHAIFRNVAFYAGSADDAEILSGGQNVTGQPIAFWLYRGYPSSMTPFHWLFDKFYPLIRFFYERVQGHRWFDEISPSLWLGGAPTYDRDYQFLLENNISAVLNIRAERNDDVSFYDTHDIAYLQLPVLDVMVPPPASLDAGVAFIERNVREGRLVLVHCAKGRGRSATVLAAYLMRKHNMSYDEANKLLKSNRSLVNLQKRHERVLSAWDRDSSKEHRSAEPQTSKLNSGV